MNAAPAVEAEQRGVEAVAASGLQGQQLADARPVRDQPALAELAAPHLQDLPAVIDVTDAQAACFPGAARARSTGRRWRGRPGPGPVPASCRAGPPRHRAA